MKQIETVEIEDTIYEETYTAHIQKNGSAWIGWIPEVPDVKCLESTQEELLQTLEKELHKALVSEDEAWDKEIEEDIKAGRLDRLRQEALQDLRAGKCIDL